MLLILLERRFVENTEHSQCATLKMPRAMALKNSLFLCWSKSEEKGSGKGYKSELGSISTRTDCETI